MRFTQHTSNNSVLQPPAGATVEECRPLPVTRVHFPDGTQAVLSYWRPTPQERSAIAAGALVQLCVYGTTHPPVMLAADGAEDAVRFREAPAGQGDGLPG